MKKFLSRLLVFLLVVFVILALVSWIMSEVHDVTWLTEIKDWLKAMKIIKDTAEPVVENTAKIKLIA